MRDSLANSGGSHGSEDVCIEVRGDRILQMPTCRGKTRRRWFLQSKEEPLNGVEGGGRMGGVEIETVSVQNSFQTFGHEREGNVVKDREGR